MYRATCERYLNGINFLSLNTLREVTRDQWVELPIPDDVIQRINEVAQKQKLKVGKDPTFRHKRDTTIDAEDNQPTAGITDEPERIVTLADNALPLEPTELIEDHTSASVTTQDTGQDLLPDPLPEINYQVDQDGDVILDDADAIFIKQSLV